MKHLPKDTKNENHVVTLGVHHDPNVSSIQSIEFCVDKTFQGSHEKEAKVVKYIGSPHQKVLTGSEDKTLRVWDYETCQHLAFIPHEHPVKDIVQMHRDVVISCCKFTINIWDVIRIHPYLRLQKTISSSAVCSVGYRLLKLEDDLFFASGEKIGITNERQVPNLSVLSLSGSEGEIVKPLGTHLLTWYSVPCRSKKYKGCFYINIDDDRKRILLLDYTSKNPVKKQIESIDYVNTLCTFLNPLGEEIIMWGGDLRRINFYNTSTDKKILPKDDRSYLEYWNGLYSSVTLHSKGSDLLFVGDYGGRMSIIDLKAGRYGTRVDGFYTSEKIGRSLVRIEVVAVTSVNSFIIIVSVGKEEVKTIKVSSPRFDLRMEEDGQEIIDLRERVDYLLEGFKEEESKICIVLGNLVLNNHIKIPRFLLLL